MSILNKRLDVGEVMLDLSRFPIVTKTTILKEALEKMDTFRLGVACITGNDGQLLGIITDGDVRRGLLKGLTTKDKFISIINKNPVTANHQANFKWKLEMQV